MKDNGTVFMGIIFSTILLTSGSGSLTMAIVLPGLTLLGLSVASFVRELFKE